jgi:hypothetical protein
LVAYNTAFLASFVLAGVAAYLFGFVLTRQHAASLVGAVAFAFSPYRLSHLNHLQLLASFWMPISLMALHIFSRDGRTRWAVWFAGAWLVQALTSGYYFFQFSLLIVLWLLWYARSWPAKRVAILAVCWLSAGVLMLPLLAGYKRIQTSYGFRRVPSEIAYYSADVAGIASAPPESRFWRARHPVDKPESQLFPGITLPLLICAGIFASRSSKNDARDARDDSMRRAFAFYTVAAAVMWVVSLGPNPAFEGRTLGVPGPYRALMLLPGFSGIRVPARIWMNAVLSLAAAGAIVVSRIKSSHVRLTVAAVSVAGLLLDGWPSSIQLVGDPGMQITHSVARARLGLPLTGNETETMYGAIAQARPVFNGYSGYTAPQHHALADLLERGDERIFQHLAAGGAIEVIVRHRLDPEGRWRRLVASARGAGLSDVTPDWSAFEIPASPPIPVPRAGAPLPIAHVDASVDDRNIGAVLDHDLESRWHTRRQLGGEAITADLGTITQPAAIVLSLGVYAGQYPRALDVSISTDRIHWERVWSGDTALEAYDAAVREPRTVPLTIPLPSRDARFVRLEQTGIDPHRGWSIVELEVTR